GPESSAPQNKKELLIRYLCVPALKSTLINVPVSVLFHLKAALESRNWMVRQACNLSYDQGQPQLQSGF
ncbi:mCG1889, partial [Mus musculus]